MPTGWIERCSYSLHYHTCHPPNSFLNSFLLLDQRHNLPQIIYDRFQLRDGFGGEVLRFGRFVGVFQRVVLEPGDVEFVLRNSR